MFKYFMFVLHLYTVISGVLCSMLVAATGPFLLIFKERKSIAIPLAMLHMKSIVIILFAMLFVIFSRVCFFFNFCKCKTEFSSHY